MTLAQSTFPTQRNIQMRTRPLRFGFIVERSIDQETLSHLVHFCASVWGGKYSLFVPTDGRQIREDWYRILYMHDPDVIFFVGAITESLKNRLYCEFQPMQIFVWDNNLATSLFEGTSYIRPILVRSVLHRIYLDERNLTPQNSRIRYPIIDQGPFATYLEMICGSYYEASRYIDALEELGSSRMDCTPQTISAYLDVLDNLSQWFVPYQLTEFRLNSTFPLLLMGNYYLVITSGLIDDLFLFHLLRWSPAGMTAIIPQEVLSNEDDIRTLGEWFGTRVHGNGFTLASHSMSIRELEALRDRLKRHLPERTEGWGVDIQRCNFLPAIPTISNTERQQTVMVDGSRLSFDVLRPDFVDQIDQHARWICEFKQSGTLGNRQGFVPSMFPDLNALLSNMDRQFLLRGGWGSSIRIARGDLAVGVSKETDIAHISLPSHHELIKRACENAGYEFLQHRSSYYQGIINLFGGIREIDLLLSEHIIRLFLDRDFIQGLALTPTRMQRRLGISRDDISNFCTQIQVLANRHVLLRGYNLTCDICGLPAWYNISTLEEYMICQGCMQRFPLPLTLSFAFRLNSLFQDRQTQGALTVLLTLLLLYSTSDHSLIWQADVNLRGQQGGVNVDLIAMCDGRLILSECKNRILGSPDPDETESEAPSLTRVLEQLQRGIVAARTLNADLFLFATLDDTIPQEITDLIHEQNQQEDHLAVRLVTRNELIRGRFEPADNEQGNTSISDLVKELPVFSSESCFQRDPNAPRMVSWSI